MCLEYREALWPTDRMGRHRLEAQGSVPNVRGKSAWAGIPRNRARVSILVRLAR